MSFLIFVSSSNSCTLGLLYNELLAQGRPLQLKLTNLRASILKNHGLVVVDSFHGGSSEASRCGCISREVVSCSVLFGSSVASRGPSSSGSLKLDCCSSHQRTTDPSGHILSSRKTFRSWHSHDRRKLAYEFIALTSSTVGRRCSILSK